MMRLVFFSFAAGFVASFGAIEVGGSAANGGRKQGAPQRARDNGKEAFIPRK
jgi:hypothetical protein